MLKWKLWCDATMMMLAADAGGSGGGDGEGASDESGGETPTAEALAAKVAELQKALKAANREAAERRVKLQEVEDADKKRKEQEQSEVQRAQAKAAEAEQKLAKALADVQTRTIRHAVEMAAGRLNFHDPADAYALADLVDVQVADDGKVTGVEEALKALAKSKPHLVKLATTGGDINAGSRGSSRAPTVDELAAQKRRRAARRRV